MKLFVLLLDLAEYVILGSVGCLTGQLNATLFVPFLLGRISISNYNTSLEIRIITVLLDPPASVPSSFLATDQLLAEPPDVHFQT